MNIVFKATGLFLGSLLLAACSSSDSDDDSSGSNTDTGDTTVSRSYEISIVNMTNNQPFSPIAVITHTADYTPWQIGSPASSGLEIMAEGGDNSELIGSELTDVDATAVSGDGPLGPGGTGTLVITSDSESQTQLTVVTMLVNTNDAFAGVANVNIGNLESGQTMSLVAPTYDAGTESNSELAGTIPGPADGGEGYNSSRDDIDAVSRHMGVVTQDDGLSNSVLNESHRFDHPTMRITISRQ